VAISREEILRSLDEQRARLTESIVLTPADSLPFFLADRHRTAFLHGLYLSDKVRDEDAQQETVIQFGGREQAAHDLDAIHKLLADRLGAAAGSMRLLAGLHAQAATFMSIAEIGDSVLLLSDEGGGHFSTAAILGRLGLRVITLPLDRARLCVDPDATRVLIKAEQPDFVFVDRSEGLRYEDFGWLATAPVPVKVFDASHYVAQIMSGIYENPLEWGFDLMLFTLHKSFPGPQKAAIVTRSLGPIWDRTVAGLSLLVSSSHAESTYLAGLALLRDDLLETYVERLVPTALLLEQELSSRGIPVVPRAAQGEPDWPASHHIWVQYGPPDAAFAAFQLLAAANLHVNYRKLPYGLDWGLRLGTSHAVSSGLTTAHIGDLADVISDALDGAETNRMRERVAALAQKMADNAIVAPGSER
jgi:glycine hydroxymethyltransferase